MVRRRTGFVRIAKVKNPKIREVKRVEKVETRQGVQYVDTKALSKIATSISNKVDNHFKWKSVEECEKAEEDFREYLKKQGYTRF